MSAINQCAIHVYDLWTDFECYDITYSSRFCSCFLSCKISSPSSSLKPHCPLCQRHTTKQTKLKWLYKKKSTHCRGPCDHLPSTVAQCDVGVVGRGLDVHNRQLVCHLGCGLFDCCGDFISRICSVRLRSVQQNRYSTWIHTTIKWVNFPLLLINGRLVHNFDEMLPYLKFSLASMSESTDEFCRDT